MDPPAGARGACGVEDAVLRKGSPASQTGFVLVCGLGGEVSGKPETGEKKC